MIDGGGRTLKDIGAIGRRPWLWVPPQLAHTFGPFVIRLWGQARAPQVPEWRPFQFRHLRFPNRLGLAGGVDKDAQQIAGWWAFGAGFVEIGTITPLPQSGNPGPVLRRDFKNRALWNRLGFPSQGLAAVTARLRHLPLERPTPLFANLGKNRNTPTDQASADYQQAMETLAPYVDGFVINISSPNTRGLRDLLKVENLSSFLAPIVAAHRQILAGAHGRRPILLLKLSPDMAERELDTALETSIRHGIDGWVLTNTSAASDVRAGLVFPEEGGISGRPLAPKACAVLRRAVSTLGSERRDRLIISCGGVLTSEDVQNRLEMGADLVEVYSALVFHGPSFFNHVAQAQAQDVAK